MTLPFYPFYWGDYSSKTFNLTQGQHGAYMLFMRHIYATGDSIPNDQRYIIAKALLEEERKNADFVLKEFFILEGEFWDHERVREVMKEANELHKKRVKAGKTKGKLKLAQLKPGLSPAQARPEQPQPQPQPQPDSNKDSLLDHEKGGGKPSETVPEKPEKKPPASHDDFPAFWQSYPRRVAKGAARKAWSGAIGKTSPETILEATKAFARLQAGKDEEFIPHPATWLNAERWQDAELAVPEKSQGTISKSGGNVVIEEGSPEWEAWCKYRKTIKALAPTARPVIDPVTSRRFNGWYFPTLLPPTPPKTQE